jgi:hypothetical protein
VFAKLGLFTQPVQLHPVVQSVYLPQTIPPEMHNPLPSIASNIKTGQAQQQQADAAQAQHATKVATQTRQALETGGRAGSHPAQAAAWT